MNKLAILLRKYNYIIFLEEWRMNQNHKKLTFVLILLLIITMFSSNGVTKEIKAFSPQVIQHGAIGDDVIELQARLKHIGFYTGEIDGVFGWRTYWALRNFQYEFGMPIDGMAGQQTKDMLVKSTEYDEAATKAEMYQTPGSG